MRKKTEETTGKIAKSIPISENGPGVLCITKSGQRYQISQNVEKMRFTLWKIVGGGFIKVKIANSPTELDSLIPWDQ